MDMRWFPRLAAIPGIDPAPIVDVEVDVGHLPGAGRVPEVNSYVLDGRQYISLGWTDPSTGLSTSASPAHEHARARPAEDAGPEAALRHLAEVMALPGIPSDWHHAIGAAGQVVHQAARVDPSWYDTVVGLCHLDIALCRARPDAAGDVDNGVQRWYQLGTVQTLVRLHHREGFLHEALEVAEVAVVEFDQLHLVRDELRERLAVLGAEVDG